MGGLGGMMQNPQAMQQMMDNAMRDPVMRSMMDSMMSNPEVLRSMLQGNPMVREVRDGQDCVPSLGHGFTTRRALLLAMGMMGRRAARRYIA